MDDAEFCALLPARRVVDCRRRPIGMVHDPGARRVAKPDWPRFPGCDLVVYGHTHVPDLTSLGTIRLLNPGSPDGDAAARRFRRWPDHGGGRRP